MNHVVKDLRSFKMPYAIKELAEGTWFATNFGLFLKVDQSTVVDGETGKRVNFNEEHLAQPVEVELHVVRDIV